MQEIRSEEMYGIAKKFNQEMEALPMHTHSAIVEMVRVGMQHRNLKMQKEDKDKQDAMNERVVALQEQHMALARDEAERNAAREVLEPGPELVRQ